ncbi:MAG: hypothetical protein WDM77_15210 [Steroidobacteraceae bacterium]
MVGIPLIWLLLLFLLPFLIVLKLSFSETRLAIPPYAPLLEWINGLPHPALHLYNYAFLFTDPLYISAYLYSLQVAAVSTLLCLLLGYPMAYVIARATGMWRSVLLMLIVLPFWTSFLLRVYAWIGLLKHNGVINNILLYLGSHPSAADHAADRLCRVCGHRVFLSAVHDPAAVMPIWKSTMGRCWRQPRIWVPGPSPPLCG